MTMPAARFAPHVEDLNSAARFNTSVRLDTAQWAKGCVRNRLAAPGLMEIEPVEPLLERIPPLPGRLMKAECLAAGQMRITNPLFAHRHCPNVPPNSNRCKQVVQAGGASRWCKQVVQTGGANRALVVQLVVQTNSVQNGTESDAEQPIDAEKHRENRKSSTKNGVPEQTPETPFSGRYWTRTQFRFAHKNH